MQTGFKKEIEFKWRVSSPRDYKCFITHAKKLGAQLKPPQKKSIKDFYLDTSDYLFAKTRTKCRLRLMNRHWELTQKTATIVNEGAATRKEKTISLPNFPSYRKVLAHCAKRIFKGKKLEKVFTVENKRTAHTVILPGKVTAEVCFDNVKIFRGNKTIRMREIELELIRGNLTHFNAFAHQLTRLSGLELARKSKVATALEAFPLLPS